MGSFNRPHLLGTILDAFRLKADRADTPQMSLEVAATYDVNEILETPTVATATKDLSAAGSVYTAYFTVPDGKRWRVRLLHRLASAANTRWLVKQPGITEIAITVRDTVASTLLPAVKMAGGWSIGLETTGNAGDTAITATIMYEEFSGQNPA